MKTILLYKQNNLGQIGYVKIWTIPIYPYAQCANNPNFKHWFTENMICGGKEELDTCKGESGGPLVAEVDGKFTLIGVTSWGVGKGRLLIYDSLLPIGYWYQE